ncbi:hypothetical protein Hanom_Chr15g01414711 [Helianthus anomalus]
MMALEVINAKGVVYHEDVMVNKMFTKLSAQLPDNIMDTRKGGCDIYWIRGMRCVLQGKCRPVYLWMG